MSKNVGDFKDLGVPAVSFGPGGRYVPGSAIAPASSASPAVAAFGALHIANTGYFSALSKFSSSARNLSKSLSNNLS